MKKNVKLLICCGILGLSVVGCGGNKDKKTPQSSKIEEEILEEEVSYSYIPEFLETDETDYMTEYTYDENYNLTEATSYELNGDVHGFTLYTYDENGNLIQKDIYTETRKPIESFIYDGKGNCTKEIHYPWQDGFIGGLYEEILREYDEKGNLIKEFIGDGTVNDSTSTKIFEYDEDGYCIKAVETNTGLAEIANGTEVITTMQYNEQGDLINETRTGEDFTELHNYSYKYDEDGKIIKKTYAYNHSHGSFKDEVYEYEYNTDGQMVKKIITNTSGTTETCKVFEYEYNEDGYLIKQTTKNEE